MGSMTQGLMSGMQIGMQRQAMEQRRQQYEEARARQAELDRQRAEDREYQRGRDRVEDKYKAQDVLLRRAAGARAEERLDFERTRFGAEMEEAARAREAAENAAKLNRDMLDIFGASTGLGGLTTPAAGPEQTGVSPAEELFSEVNALDEAMAPATGEDPDPGGNSTSTLGWLAHEKQAWDAIRAAGGGLEEFKNFIEMTGTMRKSGTVEALTQGLAALQSGDKATAARMFSKASNYTANGTRLATGFTEQGELIGAALDERTGEITGEPFIADEDWATMQLNVIADPENALATELELERNREKYMHSQRMNAAEIREQAKAEVEEAVTALDDQGYDTQSMDRNRMEEIGRRSVENGYDAATAIRALLSATEGSPDPAGMELSDDGQILITPLDPGSSMKQYTVPPGLDPLFRPIYNQLEAINAEQVRLEAETEKRRKEAMEDMDSSVQAAEPEVDASRLIPGMNMGLGTYHPRP